MTRKNATAILGICSRSPSTSTSGRDACRRDHPRQKYRGAGFEILAVSVDQSGAGWRDGIKKDNATWQHISDLTGWKTPLAARYNVSALPASFLLDPAGRILAKDARGPRLAALLEQHLGRAVAR